jgi:uncharacterized membrane protein
LNRNLWLQAALVVSVAFNVATVMMYFSMPPAGRPRTPEEFIARAAHNMSAEDAAKVKDAFAAYGDQFHDRHTASEQAMDDVRAALAAEPFDENRLIAAMDHAREAHEASESIFQKAVTESARELSHEGRMELMPPPPRSPADGQPPHRD